ncbi:DUF1993 domain-containing protein [Brevundimonas sp.]|uniref:DUF1993 domain-containing protein n=1 Tax=Brevundimonas sp. TaxID=1871086 RepID=UPI002487629A|nr:DUF1993 domain-containing protein [Brevundimonas sp.]MDI1282745.1 DUF1993 domain-containing protein [Brevundimonas sp.]
MATELYDLTVPVFTKHLTALSGLLDKARDHAAATEQDAAALLEHRLIADMHPLTRQVQMAADSAKLCVARLSGIAAPVAGDTETTIDQLQARIRLSLDYLASVPRTAVDGQEERAVVLTFPSGEMHFTGRDYAVGFAWPNFYFHLTTAYALLRARGVPLGKRDFFGGL